MSDGAEATRPDEKPIPYVRDDELVRIGVGNLSTTMSARQWFATSRPAVPLEQEAPLTDERDYTHRLERALIQIAGFDPVEAALDPQWSARIARAAIAAPRPLVSEPPAGWKLVPIEPTEAMHAAAVRTIFRCNGNDDFPPRVWRAMLAAAPASLSPAPSITPEPDELPEGVEGESVPMDDPAGLVVDRQAPEASGGAAPEGAPRGER